jgi:nucleolar protein 14
MAPSQLKKLKASLRESGVVGPQKSKKQKKQAGKSGALREGRIQRHEALNSIRERFAPFETKTPARNKFEFVSRNGVVGKATKGVVGRPGVTKAVGEENVRSPSHTSRDSS